MSTQVMQHLWDVVGTSLDGLSRKVMVLLYSGHLSTSVGSSAGIMRFITTQMNKEVTIGLSQDAPRMMMKVTYRTAY